MKIKFNDQELNIKKVQGEKNSYITIINGEPVSVDFHEEKLSDLYYRDTIDKSILREIKNDISAGKMKCFTAEVENLVTGEDDYLGQCVYKSHNEFMTLENDFFQDMLNNVTGG